MSSDRRLDLTLQLQKLMQQVGINSFQQLYRSTQLSAHTFNKLRSGKINQLQLQTLVKISSTLQISLHQLIRIFGDSSITDADQRSIATLQQEYQHLYQKFEHQRATLQAEFQVQSLQTIESFLTYFPAAKHAAKNNPDFPASKLIPLVQSIDQLISHWGVSTIGEIGSALSYDPQWHQLIEGTANLGELVTVRYIGYHQGEKLIFRAKVMATRSS
jgi:DNA-binding Xre family transcriptional regulator/molecular chaperone GrpE (heat shock protein)